jgi:hypothetical protein
VIRSDKKNDKKDDKNDDKKEASGRSARPLVFPE